jgi:hypothetical protein
MPLESPLVRDGDPGTSHDAARSVVEDGTIANHEGRILAVLYDCSPCGATASEIAVEVRRRWHIEREMVFCKHSVCRRLGALVAAELISRRIDLAETYKAKSHYAYLAGQGKAPRKRPGRKLMRRGGETIHYYGPAHLPLLARLSPASLIQALNSRPMRKENP